MTRFGTRQATRSRHLIAGAMLLVSVLLLACGAIDDDPPPRSPLGETSTQVASATAPASATVTPTPTPTPVDTPTSPPTSTPLPGATAVGTPPAALAESATGRAIELLAEWLGVPQTGLSVVNVEAVVWPDACLGVAAPMACAQTATPGFRVRLRDAVNVVHSIHSDATGNAVRWAGESTVRGEVTSVDASARRIVLNTGGYLLELRLAPGTRWTPANAEAMAVGHRVAVGYDPASTGAGAAALGTAAWLVLDPP